MTSKRLLASAGAVLLAATGLTIGVDQSASAATCYGGAETFKKAEGAKYVPGSGWYKTTSRCNDINIKVAREGMSRGRNVRVCFENGGCQSAYKLATVNEWTVIATNVKDGTTFRFQFETAPSAAGAWAA
ncbi:hypothetical protein AB0F43_28640 [Kribbella sp. NPDC023972]|uniref:hypothetical protein n=1 Tax=Kribbella sp. NPDC023972 TaxID=3154795 RepID=UPI0033C6EBD1